ncbi:MAG: helix-turn-helix domain-containing protein [Nanoarchaeota archaeon]|nr:helix-turn-helix domain-containing protein [Nanoarchaeota archaeon]
METSALKELGLTENEVTIYFFLLKVGESTTGLIIKETGISNSRVYESLNSLAKKGFVSYNIQRNGKHFQATNPKILLEKEEERKNKLKKLIPELVSMTNLREIETNTAVYEGYEGFKTAFKKIIDDCPKDKEIFILGFSEQQYKTESLRLFLENMNLKSSAKKQKLKIILDKSVKETLGRDREKEKFTEVKYMPKGYVSPGAIDIFEDYVYIFLWEERPFVFMIKNKKIAESFKQYFTLLWKIAKK